jgi:hypothetical protein
LDVIPAPFAGERWVVTLPPGVTQPGEAQFIANGELFWEQQPPVIRAGRFCAPEHFLQSGARYYPSSYARLGEGLNQAIVPTWPITLLLDAFTMADPDSGIVDASLYEQTSSAQIAVTINRLPSSCEISGYVYDTVSAGTTFGLYATASEQSQKVAVHLTTDGAYLIAGGAVLESFVGVLQESDLTVLAIGVSRRGATLHTTPSVTRADEGLNSVELYQGITLDQAIALTVTDSVPPPPPPPPSMIYESDIYEPGIYE